MPFLNKFTVTLETELAKVNCSQQFRLVKKMISSLDLLKKNKKLLKKIKSFSCL